MFAVANPSTYQRFMEDTGLPWWLPLVVLALLSLPRVIAWWVELRR